MIYPLYVTIKRRLFTKFYNTYISIACIISLVIISTAPRRTSRIGLVVRIFEYLSFNVLLGPVCFDVRSFLVG